MDIILRILVVYVFIMAALRILGKRELGELSPFELIMLIMIPELVSNALQREIFSVTNGLVAVSTLLSLVFLTSLLTYRFQKLSEVMQGEPCILVRDGKFITKALDQERVPPEEVLANMHLAGIERIDQVKWAILEDSGQITIVPKEGVRTTHQKGAAA
jgi:uncharacterized membrane protein YcaP (DUF421 family)